MERAVPILPADDLSVAKHFYQRLGFHATFEATEVAIPTPPRDEVWNARPFGFSDPSGNTIFVIGPLP